MSRAFYVPSALSKEFMHRLGINGGRGGIRTLDTLSRMHAFQACALNHSATLPLFGGD